MALPLFADEFKTEAFEANGFLSKTDFLAFGEKIGMKPTRINKELQFFERQLSKALDLIEKGSLNDDLKAMFIHQIRSYTTQRIGYNFHA